MKGEHSKIYSTLFLLAYLFTTGCGCNERVSVVNETERSLDVQILLPHPSYKFSTTQICQYKIMLEPGESWSTQHASRTDALSPSILYHRGTVSLRVRPARSILYPWRTFSLGGETPLSARITGDLEDDPDDLAIMVSSRSRDPRPAREQPDRDFDRQFERQ